MKLDDGKIITQKQWLEEGKQLFGMPVKNWKFQCPVCKHIQTMADFEAKGLAPMHVYQECIGRHIPGAQDEYLRSKVGPCDYAAYGLFRLGRQVKYDDSEEVVHVFPFFVEKGES